MGGSGTGFFYGDYQPEDLIKKIRESENKLADTAFENQISELLGNILTNVNNRDVDTLSTHLTTIKGALESEISGTLDLRYGGSVSKHTYVDGLSDVDSLVILDNSDLSGKSPDEVKDYFYWKLKKRLPQTVIEKGRLAITVKFQNFEIQLLPALRVGDSYKIPSYSSQNTWALTNPKKFVLSLKKINGITNGKTVPVIKLAKSIIAQLPEKRRITGYHVEALAIDAFATYKGPLKTKDMLKYLFKHSSEKVLSPMKDKSGHTVHLDDYLGQSGSLERKIVSDSLSQISRKMQNADGSRNKQLWVDILGY
jgi:hypothetical protein